MFLGLLKGSLFTEILTIIIIIIINSSSSSSDNDNNVQLKVVIAFSEENIFFVIFSQKTFL